MRAERPRGGAESSNPTLGYLASYARIAIDTGKFSPPMGKLTQRTRNKIALIAVAALRLFPEIILKPCHPQGPGRRVSKNLDEIDLKILSEIQADGRITNVELAKRVGISPPPCLRRVRTLEEACYMHGYRGRMDARRIWLGVRACAAVCACDSRRVGLAIEE